MRVFRSRKTGRHARWFPSWGKTVLGNARTSKSHVQHEYKNHFCFMGEDLERLLWRRLYRTVFLVQLQAALQGREAWRLKFHHGSSGPMLGRGV